MCPYPELANEPTIAELRALENAENKSKIDGIMKNRAFVQGNVTLDLNITGSGKYAKRSGKDYLMCKITKESNLVRIELSVPKSLKNPESRIRRTITLDGNGKIISGNQYDKIDLNRIFETFAETSGNVTGLTSQRNQTHQNAMKIAS